MTVTDANTKLCEQCRRIFQWSGKGRPPRYCTPACKTAARKRREEPPPDLSGLDVSKLSDEQLAQLETQVAAERKARHVPTLREAWSAPAFFSGGAENLLGPWRQLGRDPVAMERLVLRTPWCRDVAANLGMPALAVAVDVVAYCEERMPSEPRAPRTTDQALETLHRHVRPGAEDVSEIENARLAWVQQQAHWSVIHAEQRGLDPVEVLRQTLRASDMDDASIDRALAQLGAGAPAS